MAPQLPDDILHLICLQLRHQRDFNTLYNCAQAAKLLAMPALGSLYRMHEVAPVANSGSDEVEVSRQGGPVADVRRQQDQIIIRWAELWRMIILSSLDLTAYPYCRYIRVLDLRNLKDLLDEPKFNRGAASKKFFAGELAQFNLERELMLTRAKSSSWRLNTVAAVNEIGEVVTKQTPMVEELAGEISSEALSSWIPRLPRLQHLTLWRGAALAQGVGSLINTYCPVFKTLRFYDWSDSDADAQFAAFLNALRPQTLELLEIISQINIGAQTCQALNWHGESLKDLKLNSIKPEALPHLPLLNGCTSLTSLTLTEFMRPTDLENTQNDVFVELINWLRGCKHLQNITFRQFGSSPAILTSLLLESDIHLSKLELEGYVGKEAREFHRALAHQKSLRSVVLKGDPDDLTTDDMEILVDSLCQLENLTDLRLKDISEDLRVNHIRQLARSLPVLEEWWTGGWEINDEIWDDVAALTSLKALELSAFSYFTAEGILEFVSKLGPGNKGFVLSIMMASPDSDLTEEEQSLIREVLATQVEGRFDHTLARDPNVSEFEGESD
ncbi:hypothetical protein MMC20_004976 [Loxospora ochrophaea]|nr:hypothetical protein [Loxospora ochrophaea]